VLFAPGVNLGVAWRDDAETWGVDDVWNIILRNMQFRARQLLITIVGTALVFAMALLVTGLKQAFKTEADRAVDSIGGDAWVVPAGTEGPSTSLNFMPAGSWNQIRAEPGVRRADPVLLVPQTIRKGSDTKQLVAVGHQRHGLGEPPPEEGRRSRRAGEVVVDKKLGFGLGDTFTVSGSKFTAVGLVSGHTIGGGQPMVYVPIEDVWALLHDGMVAKAVVITGTPRHLPEGYKALSRQEVRDDALRPLRSAESAINNTRLLLWLVAAVIVGVVMYMSALERVRDFAVLKAVGATTRTLVLSLAAEAVLTCLIAAALAIGVAQLLLPIFPLPITYTLGAYAALPVIAVVVGVLASLAGVRRAVRVDPATAFAGT
jgi:putative ABC transport system permease protein